MSYQHFRGEKLYSDIVVKPENKYNETERVECYPVSHDAEENSREEGWYPDSTVVYIRVLWKEFRVSLLMGVVLSAVNFIKILVVDNMLLQSNVSMEIAIVICITLFSAVVIAKLVGCTLPIIAKKIGFDPAVMASPFITTIVDALALLVYFGVASAILNI